MIKAKTQKWEISLSKIISSGFRLPEDKYVTASQAFFHESYSLKISQLHAVKVLFGHYSVLINPATTK